MTNISITDKIADSLITRFPSKTINSEKWKKVIKRVGDFTLVENRLLIGAVAFSTQPWIDLYNKDVDEETRKMSCLRTCAKVIIGTATGVSVRWACIKSMDRFTRTADKCKGDKWEKALIPNQKLVKELENGKEVKKWVAFSHEEVSKATRVLKKHRDAMGAIIAIAVMMLTDPPLTIFMTNFFNKQRKELEQKKAAQKGEN